MADEDVSSLLVVVVDVNPVWWGMRSLKHNLQEGNIVLSYCLNSITAFANAHLTLSRKNKLAILASIVNESHFLYPKPLGNGVIQNGEAAPKNGPPLRDGRYEVFSEVDSTIVSECKELITKNTQTELHSDCLLAGAMAMALCYIHRLEKECAVGEKMSSRILVVRGSEDNPSQYMNFMNVVFTAQKQNVVLDACVLDNTSGLLQQACDITGGIYLKVPQLDGLLQYLLWVFLPDPVIRDQLSLPPKSQVDYRAACFCHRNLIDVGYVCSVCLSIFCTFSPICSTCQTTFKFKGPPKLLKKKMKKSTT